VDKIYTRRLLRLAWLKKPNLETYLETEGLDKEWLETSFTTPQEKKLKYCFYNIIFLQGISKKKITNRKKQIN